MKILTEKQIIATFGKFRYVEEWGGLIKIDDQWVKENIHYEKDMPVVGRVICHEKIGFHLLKIFYEIEKAGLALQIKQEDFIKNGGCFMPRHILRDPKRALSRHSWGIAIDINPTDNPYGAESKLHPSIVAIFEKNGFIWGGRWQTKDCMHFEVSDNWREFKPYLLLDDDVRWPR